MKKNLKNYLTITLSVGALVVVGTVAVSAAEASAKKRMGISNDGGGKRNVNAFMEDGLIDQTTADKISAYMEQKMAERETEKANLESMTETEKQAYLESRKDRKPNDMFSEMVSAGAITQEEADKLKESMPAPPENMRDRGMGRGMMNLGALVESGIIDQATADKISAYMEEKIAERKVGMDNVKDMTESEKQAHLESMKDRKEGNMFTEMVSAGVITEEQADKIKENSFQRRADNTAAPSL